MQQLTECLKQLIIRFANFLSRHRWILVVVAVLLFLWFVFDVYVNIAADFVFISDFLENQDTSVDSEFWDLYAVVASAALVTISLSFLWFLLFSLYYHFVMLLSGRVQRKRRPKQ